MVKWNKADGTADSLFLLGPTLIQDKTCSITFFYKGRAVDSAQIDSTFFGKAYLASVTQNDNPEIELKEITFTRPSGLDSLDLPPRMTEQSILKAQKHKGPRSILSKPIFYTTITFIGTSLWFLKERDNLDATYRQIEEQSAMHDYDLRRSASRKNESSFKMVRTFFYGATILLGVSAIPYIKNLFKDQKVSEGPKSTRKAHSAINDQLSYPKPRHDENKY